MRRYVDANHAAAIGSQQLHRQLSEQAQTQHDDVSPSVGAQRRTPCSAIAPSVTVLASISSTASGTCTARLTGDAHQFGMVGDAGASAGDPIATRESFHRPPTSSTSPATE